MSAIFHLAASADWDDARGVGRYEQSTVDRTLAEEGFIHCSFAGQVQATADRYLRGRDDVVLLVIDQAQVADILKVEDTSGRGEMYPHLYGPLPVAAVTEAVPVPLGADGRIRLDDLVDGLVDGSAGG